MQTSTTTQIENTVFLFETSVIIELLKIFGDQNQLPIRIGKALKHRYTIKLRNPTPQTQFLNLNIF